MISDSKFYMWRAIFSLAHADGIVTAEEKHFMEEKLESLNVSLEQREILQADMLVPREAQDMFLKITDAQDQTEFFNIARNLVMSDGEYHKSEQGIMAQIQRLQVAQSDVDSMVGNVHLELESAPSHKRKTEEKKGFFSFFRRRT